MVPVPSPGAVGSSSVGSESQHRPIDISEGTGCSLETESDLSKLGRSLENSHLVTIPSERYSRCKAAQSSSNNNDAQVDRLPVVRGLCS